MALPLGLPRMKGGGWGVESSGGLGWMGWGGHVHGCSAAEAGVVSSPQGVLQGKGAKINQSKSC